MLTLEKLSNLLPEGRQAFAGFLDGILDLSSPLEVNGPHPVSKEAIKQQFDNCFALLGRSRSSEPFLVLLDAGWLPLLSNAVLNRRIEEWNESANELINQLAPEAHAHLHEALSSHGIMEDETNYTVLAEADALPSELLPEDLLQVSLLFKNETTQLNGHLLLPFTPEQTGTANTSSEPAALDPANPSNSAKQSSPAEPAAPNPSEAKRPEEPTVDVAVPSFPSFDDASGADAGEIRNFDLLSDVEIELSVELGRRRMPLSDILRLTNGSIVELDKLAGEPLQIYANNRLIAEGEAVVIDDQFGVRITRLASAQNRAQALL